ncbi:helix-turn-helix domain-containing protein [Bradyrhizobium sp. CCGB20]|uniref:MarR family transcriptional regulator n=1 Tax=Bradyrhizobium sp. CCGB20 TaxID=2949633 RepID=UPI0020B24299|nr:MarR family transcriptional regulator [Bradyrhizobium sp. CCGB20]MCP3400383.1 MarR family winged helix-turn-helix transcriptional regulator [Bradyrhizobium sp. CCGB20]
MTAKGASAVTNDNSSIEDAKWVETLTLIINEFRKISPDITANQMLVLLHAGAKPGITQKELSKATDLADGTVSRICALMSDRGHQGREGLNVISIDPIPGDFRSKGQKLIGAGKKMYASVRNLMTNR